MSNITKSINKRNMLDEAKKMLKHFEDFNFFKYCKNMINLGFNGENLKQNVFNEWLLSNSITCDEATFVGPSVNVKSDIWNVIGDIWLKANVLPCNIILKNQIEKHQDKYSDKMLKYPNAIDFLSSQFQVLQGLNLEKYTFCEPHSATEMFWKLHKDRQRWWKKFSASPGRFSTSEILKCENAQFIDIQAEFSWGKVAVERLKMFDDVSHQAAFSSKENSSTSPSIILCELLLEKAALTFLCDSFEVLDEKKAINMLRLHRKMAPFKVAFAGVPSSPAEEQNLKDLALLLTKLIRKSLISVLLLPDVCSIPLEDQFLRNDSLGIPYTVVLNDETLKNGLLGIRSRDTTIQEDSHVGSLVPYVEKLMKNY